MKTAIRIVFIDKPEKRDERGGNQLLSPTSGVLDGAIKGELRVQPSKSRGQRTTAIRT